MGESKPARIIPHKVVAGHAVIDKDVNRKALLTQAMVKIRNPVLALEAVNKSLPSHEKITQAVLNRWLDTDELFKERYEWCQDEATAQLEALAYNIAISGNKGGPDGVMVRWLLERTAPEKYGKQRGGGGSGKKGALSPFLGTIEKPVVMDAQYRELDEEEVPDDTGG